MRKKRLEQYEQCPIEATLDLIGGKWKGSILYLLDKDTLRFGEIRKRFTKITQRTLTKQLRELEKDGFISRKIYAEVPPRVEYSITKLGRTLRPTLIQLKKWGENHVL